MGRVLKRVPLDFKWPLKQVWKGYVNPYNAMRCEACDGTGLNPETRKLSDDWYTCKRTDGQEGWAYHLEQEDVQALLDAGRLMDFTRVPLNEEQEEIVRKKVAAGGNSWLPFNNGRVPTADEVNKWAKDGFGHDGINHDICVKARAKRLGFYGDCEFCKGEGELWQTDEMKALNESWEMFEPPIGDGYQLWSTTSGSPYSPVFETLDELCGWCEVNATVFGNSKASKEEWKEMLVDDIVVHKEGKNIFL